MTNSNLKAAFNALKASSIQDGLEITKPQNIKGGKCKSMGNSCGTMCTKMGNTTTTTVETSIPASTVGTLLGL